jgi:MoxR-like ATPase
MRADTTKSIVPFDSNHLSSRLAEAAERLGEDSVSPREIEHLVGVVHRCSVLLEDVYTGTRLRAILGSDPHQLISLLAGSWLTSLIPRDENPELFQRLTDLPDKVRGVGDQALFDLGISGRQRVQGIPLESLGPRAYSLAAEVLEVLAEDARLSRLFLENRVGWQGQLEQEIEFLRLCASRFDLYSRILREAGGVDRPAGEASLFLPAKAAPPGVPARREAGPRPGRARETASEGADDGAPSPVTDPGAAPHPIRTVRKLPWLERLLLFSSLDLEDLHRELSEIVIDQPEAIEALCDDLSLLCVGTQPDQRPPSYFLVGPTGVGKNYLVETLVGCLERRWEAEVPMLTIEGPNYTYPSDINELRGATRGFIRSDEPGLLTEFHEKVKDAPLGVILVDEIEKAHPQLRRFFLSIMDRGVTTDAQGNELHLDQTLIFFTSNIGYRERSPADQPIGFGGIDHAEAAYHAELDQSIKKALSPEFINRLRLVRFRHLPRASAVRIARLEFERIAERYRAHQDLDLVLTEDGLEAIVDRGYSHQYGARYLNGVLQALCNVEISKLVRRDQPSEPRDHAGLLEQLRDVKAGAADTNIADLERRILEQARARVPYRRVVVDAEEGEIVYRREGEREESCSR